MVLLELWRLRLLEGDGHAGDGVVVRAALQRREDRGVDPLDSGEEETRFMLFIKSFDNCFGCETNPKFVTELSMSILAMSRVFGVILITYYSNRILQNKDYRVQHQAV